MTQVAQITHGDLEHLLLAAVFGRTARGRKANSPPCPDHHTRERKKQKQPDLHRLSISQSGTGRCVKSARRINRHRPAIGGRGYRAINQQCVGGPGDQSGKFRWGREALYEITTFSLCPYLMEGSLQKKSTFSTYQDAEAIPRQ